MRTINSTLTLLLIAAMTIFFLNGCRKYENGGLIARADKRLSVHTWELEKYLRNGTDATAALLISNFTEQFQEGGIMTRTYTDKNQDPFSETGIWKFKNNDEKINVSGVSSIELTKENSTVSSSDYNILRLKRRELWYDFVNGGDTHEFRFVPQ